jgi:UPF0716 family protein affecting phage T7 exclusion
MTLHEGRLGEGRAAGPAGTGGAAGGDGRSIGELLRDLANDSTRLVRDEIALARAEATEKAKQAGAAVAMIAAGGVLAIPAFVVILHAIVLLLSNFMRDWIAGLLVGLVVAAVAALLARKGVNDLSANRLAPERTAANIKRDVHLVQEKVS